MSTDPIRFRLLGGIEAHRDGAVVDIGHARQQCVLAVLLVEANTAVSVDELIDRVWAGDAPHRAKDSLYSYLTRLRRALPEITITRRGTGYILAVDKATIDLQRFLHLIRQAATADDAAADDLLGEALALWRGEPFAGLDTPWLTSVRASLDKERSAAELDHIDIQLRLGQHNELLPKLATLATDRPLDERLAGQYLLALYRAGRQADALNHYQQTRTHLADQLGIDPSPALRDLHQQILTTDPALDSRAPEPTAQSPVPRQLPAAPRSFTGRVHELDSLTSAMDAEAVTGATVVISAIGGTGGIGKTWLALHWAHQNVNRFPDGQLFVNLRGFDPSGKPTSPDDAVRSFLDALGVEPSSIPLTLDAQTALYRSLVADKRMLIVLDNAAEPAQVVPLLPGSPSCTVIVTSRDRLAGLVNAHGAQPLPLDALSDVEARALLANRLGEERLAREPVAVNDLIASCAGLPLALSIVAGRALEHQSFPLSELAEELRNAADRLSTLDEDPSTSVRSVLSWSYAALTTEQARVFSLLGLAPGPDISLAAAASLTNLSDSQARNEIRALERISLIQQPVPGRYRMHDLVRLYADEQARQAQEPKVRDTGLASLIDFYANASFAAERELDSNRHVSELTAPRAGGRPYAPLDRPSAIAWFEVENTNLMAALTLAVNRGAYREAWQLAWSMNTFHLISGRGQDGIVAWSAGLAAARNLNDPASEILALRTLGHCYSRMDQHQEALVRLQQALTLSERAGDHLNQAHSHNALTFTLALLGEHQQALDHATRTVDLFEAANQPRWRAQSLNAVGWAAAQLGQYDRAQSACIEALRVQRDIGDSENEAGTLDSLGYIAHRVGQYPDALDYYQKSLALFIDLDDVYNQADTLQRLGEVHLDLGDLKQAQLSWERSLQLYQAQQRDAGVRQIRLLLAGLDKEPTA